jgi:hypothetical protein
MREETGPNQGPSHLRLGLQALLAGMAPLLNLPQEGPSMRCKPRAKISLREAILAALSTDKQLTTRQITALVWDHVEVHRALHRATKRIDWCAEKHGTRTRAVTTSDLVSKGKRDVVADTLKSLHRSNQIARVSRGVYASVSYPRILDLRA